MSLKQMMSEDLPDLYEALADTQAIYNGSGINVFFEDHYDIEGLSDKTIKVQTTDVPNVAIGEIISFDTTAYEVLNHSLSDDGLETYIGLNKDI